MTVNYNAQTLIDEMRFGANEIETPTTIDYTKTVGDPQIDLKHIPPNLRKTIEIMQQQYLVPLPTLFGAVIAAIGSVSSHQYDIEGLRGGAIPLNTFVLIASETAGGKSEVKKNVLAPIQEFEDKINAKQRDRDVAHQADALLNQEKIRSCTKKMRAAIDAEDDNLAKKLAEQIAELRTEKSHRNTSASLLLSDCTLPGLKKALSNHSYPLLVANAEASKFLKHMIENAGTYCGAWSGEPLRIYQGVKTIEANNPRLSLLLMTQPFFTEGLLDDDHEFRLSGLAARFLLFWPLSMQDRKHLLQHELPDTQETLAQWRNFLLNQCERNRLAMISDVPRITIQLSMEVKQYLREIEAEVERLTSPGRQYYKIRVIAFRMVEQICRLAAIFQLYETPNNDELSIDIVKYAHSFMRAYIDYISNKASGDLPGTTVKNNADKIMQFLLNSRRTFWTQLPDFNFQVQAMKLSDFQKNAPIRGKRNTEGALDLLVNERRIEIRPYPYNSGNGVRTVSLIIINNSVQNHQPNIFNALYNGNHI